MAPQNADAFLAEALVRTGSDALPYNREFVSLVHQHLLELVEDFPALRLKAQPYTHLDGRHVSARTSTLLCAQGTVPMHYGGHKYNIPVAVWLPENYPLQRPIVYVVPSHNMIIKPRRDGLQACGPRATLSRAEPGGDAPGHAAPAAQDMAMLFGSDPPLFEKPPLREQPPVIGKPPWVEQPTPWVEKPKPPPPPPKHTQESLLSAFRTAAVAELTARLQASLTVATNKAAAEAHRQMDQQVELRRREATLQQEVHALQLEAWLAENEARAAALNEGSLNPDNMLTAADPLSQQALEAQAEDLAMEDCLYELDKALQAGRVAPEAYLRQVRAVCRRQFTARVLGLKISAAQQEQQRRAAAAPQGARGGGAAYAASAAMPSRIMGPAAPAAQYCCTLSDIQEAAERIREGGSAAGAGGACVTPVFQRTGAFKVRGALNAVLSLSEAEAAHGVCTHSSGNHAAALSYAARLRGVPAHIVVPSNTPQIKRAAVESYGGRLVVCEPTIDAREAACRRVQEATGATYVPPYNDALVIAGQDTIALELLDQLDAMIVPVSGGGMLSGVAIAAKALKPGITVLAAEPCGRSGVAADVAACKARGELVRLDKPETICDGLEARLGELTWPIVRDLVDGVVVITEEEVVDAMQLCFERMKVVVEPSGAAGLAATLALTRSPAYAHLKNVGVILCGGNLDFAARGFWASFGRSAFATLCRSYVIKNGDSLWSIANANGVLQDDLLTALEQCIGFTSTTMLQVGQQICLPPWQPSCAYVANSGGVETCKMYQVQTGDTLASIASSFGLYTPDLATLNSDIYSGTGPLAVGTYLRLPPWNDATCADPGSDAPSCRVYVVTAGDSVWSIASAFYISSSDLLSVNIGLTTGSVLSPGQRIRIPGDSIALIALKFATTVADIVSANPELADPSLLTPGKTIKLPPFPDSCGSPVIVTGNANVTLPVASPVVVAKSPSPSPVVVASPSPVAASKSPSPSPKPATASPSPAVANATANASSPSPSPASPLIPSTSVKLSMTLAGASVSEFAVLQTRFIAAVAGVAGVPVSYVAVTGVASAGVTQRRLQSVSDVLATQTTIATLSPAATTATLAAATTSGSLAAALAPLGLAPSSVRLDGQAVAAPAPAPAASSADSASGGSSAPIGAIVGGVVGGVAGLLLLALVAVIVVRRRRAAAEAEAQRGLGPAGATATLTAGAPAKVMTRAARLAADEASGTSTSPRSPRQRSGRGGAGAAQGAA
eukprot:scaffold2.g6876.t1